jgi:hypothetical protein
VQNHQRSFTRVACRQRYERSGVNNNDEVVEHPWTGVGLGNDKTLVALIISDPTDPNKVLVHTEMHAHAARTLAVHLVRFAAKAVLERVQRAARN